MPRDIQKIIIHCTATPEGRKVTTDDLHRWHVVENRWSDIGYHWFIDLDGELHECRKEYRSGAHAKGHNSKSIGVCYAGGLDKEMKTKDTRTPAQKEQMRCLLLDLKQRFPKAEIIGHRTVLPVESTSSNVSA